MESSNVAKFLLIPVEIVLSLIRNPQEAACLLETTFRGQQLQDLLSLQATQQQCDASALQKVCTSLLSLNDPSLAALVPPAIQAASAATRSADMIQTKVKECLDALHMLSGHLKRHTEITSAVAVEMRRQPACQELAIERELVAAIQAEAAQRAGHIARLRGHCIALPPFSQVLESLKAEATRKLKRLLEGSAGVNAAQVAAALPSSAVVTKDRLDTIEKGLYAMNAHVNQLVRLQNAAVVAAATAPPQIEHAANMIQQQPIVQTSPNAAEGTKPPRIQELSPGGTEQPEIIRSLTFKQRQHEDEKEEERKQSRGEGQDQLHYNKKKQKQKEQLREINAAPEVHSNVGAKRKTELTLTTTQSKALRGDAAPSSSPSDDTDGNGNRSSGVKNKSQEESVGGAAGTADKNKKGNQPDFCFDVAPPAAGGHRKSQQQEKDQEPSPTPQVAAHHNTMHDANHEEREKEELPQQQQQQEEKENVDLTQSQGDASGSVRSGSKHDPAPSGKEEDDGNGVPSTQPLDSDNEEEEGEEKPSLEPQEGPSPQVKNTDDPLNPPPAVGAAAIAAAMAQGALNTALATGINALAGTRGFISQRDSYSPGNTLHPGSGSKGHTGSGSGSGVAPNARGSGAVLGRKEDTNEDTPAGPSRVAPTPVSLLCCPPPLPPPSVPTSSSVGAAAPFGGGGGNGGEKRNHQQHTTVAGGGDGTGGARVKRTRFATEAHAATAVAVFGREKSASQDNAADAELPLSGSGPSNSSGPHSLSDGGGGGGAPNTADWKTPAYGPQYGRGYGHHGFFPPTLSTWNYSQEAAAQDPPPSSLQRPTAAAPGGGSGGGGLPLSLPIGDINANANATPLNQTLNHIQYYHQHKSWVPSTIKPPRARYGAGAGSRGGKNDSGGDDQLFPFSQDQDSPRVAGAQKGATPLFLNSFPSIGDIGNTNEGVTPATCASWKAGVGNKIQGDYGSDMKRLERKRAEEDEEEKEEEQGGEQGCNASNQFRRKTPGS